MEPPSDEVTLFFGGADLLDRVAPLWLELRRHHAELAPQWSENLSAKSFDQRRNELLQKAGGGLFVLIAGARDRDIGYCVSTIEGAVGEIDSRYVVAEHRGQGIGQALMAQTMNWFTSRDIRNIAVDLLAGNDDATRFYARYGFAPRTVRMILQVEDQ